MLNRMPASAQPGAGCCPISQVGPQPDIYCGGCAGQFQTSAINIDQVRQHAICRGFRTRLLSTIPNPGKTSVANWT